MSDEKTSEGHTLRFETVEKKATKAVLVHIPIDTHHKFKAICHMSGMSIQMVVTRLVSEVAEGTIKLGVE